MREITLSNKIIVTDPCYKIDTWCTGVINNMKPGTYLYEIEMSDEGVWGTRVKSISITHKDYVQKIKDKKLTYYDATIGVDSGQAGFFDYDFYKYSKEKNNDAFYKKCCDITLSNEQVGVIDNKGLVSSSGYGDGAYDLYFYSIEDEIVKLNLVFIENTEYARIVDDE